MATLSNLLQTASSGASSASISHCMDQPAFAIHGGDWDHHGSMVYNHKLEMLGREFMSNGSNGMTHYFRGGNAGSNAADGISQMSNYHPQSNVSTDEYRMQQTNANSELGHMLFNVAGRGVYSYNYPRHTSRAAKNLGCVVGSYKQDILIFREASKAWMMPRNNWHSQTSMEASYYDYPSSKLHWSIDTQSGFSANGVPDASSGDGKGCIGYNTNTNKIAYMRRSNYNHFPVVHSHTMNLRDVTIGKTDKPTWPNNTWSTWVSKTGATIVSDGTTQQYKSSNQDGEDRNRGVTILCDNDKVVYFQMIPHVGATITRFSADANPTRELYYANQWTTSYGMDNGSEFGSRYQVTTDGKYVICYCASYYYGSGYYAAIVRVSDGKMTFSRRNDSNNGFQFATFGPGNDVYCLSSTNSDGQYHPKGGIFNCAELIDKYGDSVSSGNGVSMFDFDTYLSDQSGLDVVGYTTCYPCLIKIPYDKTVFEGRI
jgi:hypothetical protein